MRIDWHPAAADEFLALAKPDQARIKKAVDELSRLEDPRFKLVPYTATLKGYWKLRVGDFRLVCEIARRGDEVVIVMHVAHRSQAYSSRSVRTIKRRSTPR